MIIKVYKSAACLIKVDDEKILTEEGNEEIVKIILSSFIDKLETRL